MSNFILIDGWNVCWKIQALADLIPTDLEKVRSRFNQMVNRYFAGKNVTYKIVYDGQPLILPQDDFRENKVLFSRNPEKADDLIIRHLQKQRNTKNWTVVTSDMRLSLQAKDLGAKAITSEDFINALNKQRSRNSENNRKSDPKIDQNDITYWLDKFSDPDETNG